MGNRRLSQAIAEGAGISVLAEVEGDGNVDATGFRGARGLVLRGAVGHAASDHALPVLALGASPEGAADARADAVLLPADADEDELADLAERADALGIEVVAEVRDEEDLERVLEFLDPEILLLSAEGVDTDEGPLAHLLELLPDVPVGKLAIAALANASREDVEALERAGVDAVVVSAALVDSDGLIELAGDEPPEV